MSFTIKCDKCGKEQKILSTQEKYWRNEVISLHASGHEVDSIEISVYCECGNEATEY